jgi:branched-subunit amino acid transport protein
VSTSVAVIAGCAAVTAVLKGAGPAVLGGRDLPARFTGVITLLGPAVLSALVVTQALANGTRLSLDETTVGVVLAGLVAWRTGSVIACIVVAAGVTAALRLV